MYESFVFLQFMNNHAACFMPPQSVLPVQASGILDQMNGRDAHMLLQNELFLNVATREFEEGELRGQISSLLYSGLLAQHRGTMCRACQELSYWMTSLDGKGSQLVHLTLGSGR